MVSVLMEFKVQRKTRADTALRPCVKEGVVVKHMLWECRGRRLDLVFWNREGFLWGCSYNMRGSVCIHQKDSGDIVSERWNFTPKAHRGVRESRTNVQKEYRVFHVAGAGHLGKRGCFLEESWQVPGWQRVLSHMGEFVHMLTAMGINPRVQSLKPFWTSSSWWIHVENNYNSLAMVTFNKALWTNLFSLLGRNLSFQKLCSHP